MDIKCIDYCRRKNLDSKNIEEKLISGDAETLRLLGKIGNYGDML